ncbi:hypothetical protein yc1106_07199 [Curvularia clavata]|uniref:DUF3074 domain-containing protein n=1 Tax=Curvularia clavata TaxID=95742 RepID=A0A9Q8ZDV4_CURCL|nr:hypothetical protein yc1106_07199 [Curvularia clavata]
MERTSASGDSVQSQPVQLPQNPAERADAPIAATKVMSHSLRRYLDLKRLEKFDLPHHPLYDNPASDHRISVVQFFNSLFTEIEQIDFDNNVKECGTWSPKDGNVMMPPFGAVGNSQAIPVPVSVKKRILTINQERWLARTSAHSDAHVKFSELAHLLAREHSRNEFVYTPSVFDAVELLTWDQADLLKALGESEHAGKIHSVEMSIFQMFHEMPKVAGHDFLQDRVFHVLVVTTQSNHNESSSELARSSTVQLPIDYDTFNDSIIGQRSYVKKTGSSRNYQIPQGHENPGSKPSDAQRSHQGKKLTEGKYVSLERLEAASASPAPATGDSNNHRWDMMTLSTAGGLTRIAPKSVQEKETLMAVAKDTPQLLVGQLGSGDDSAMQNYGQAPGYQQPASAAGFAGQQSGPPPVPPPPPGYGASQGYQSVPPQAHSPWTTPTPTPTQAPNPWNQSQPQTMAGYNPVTYGMMPGGQRQSYIQQQDVPPPPPPKPYGLAAAVQQQQQSWSQQPQQNTSFTPQAQQGGYPTQGTPQHTYPYVPPPLPHTGRPSSMYGTTQSGSTPNTPSVGFQAQANHIPNEQPPAYIPPTVHGHDYRASNANSTNSIHAPLQHAPTWQQGQHVPPQNETQSTYMRPTVDPNTYTQGNQTTQPTYQTGQPPPLPPRTGQQTGQAQQHQQQQFHHYTQHAHAQYPPPQTHTPPPPQQSQLQQASTHFPLQQHGYTQQPPQHYGQTPYEQQAKSPSQPAQPPSQWQPPPLPGPEYNHHAAQVPYENAQATQQLQNPVSEPQYPNATKPATQESNSLHQSHPAPSNPYEVRPTSQPVSPMSSRASLSVAPGHQPSYNRTDSISSIALNNFYAQRVNDRTSSPKPSSQKIPTPPPPRDDKSKFSALAVGGPSDWEHLGGGEEIDDEALFCAKPESRNTEVAQPDSVELPAHVPSPPSTHGFPSPAVYPAHPDSSESAETYMPTPPTTVAKPSERRSPRPAQDDFVVEDAIVAPLRTTPKPVERTHSPRNRFDRESQPSPVSIQQPWTAPVSTQSHSRAADVSKPISPVITAELKAKDEIIDQLRTELQQEIERHRTTSELFKADREKFESETKIAKNHAASERDVLLAQIENMRLTADQATTNSEAAAREKGLTIDRLKEDMEGKEHNLEERDRTIVELRRQLEVEKAKEPPKPTAADLIPDLDPWYAGSLERYIAMLRSEAMEPEVEEKIKIFKAFMKAESTVRGIEFFDAPPQASVEEPVASAEPEQISGSNTTASSARPDLKVQVPPDVASEDDYQYSPGGRPIIARVPTFPIMESMQVQPQTAPSVQSTTILTPTSSVDDDTNKTPIQSRPEEQLQSQYKAYVPPSRQPEEPLSLRHRKTMSFLNTASGVSSPSPNKGHDEIFFGAGQPNPQAPVSSARQHEADSIPPPLGPFSHSSKSVPLPHEGNPNESLALLLPRHLQGKASHHIEELRAKLSNVGNQSLKMEELSVAWEDSASLTRRKNDEARRKRQEENEEHNDELFNNDEISYAEMKQLEEEFKQKEVELKAQEVQGEYRSYMDAVFNPVYSGLQAEIKELMDLYAEVEHLLQVSVSGTKSLESGDPPSTEDCLELLENIHKQVEKRHEGVVRIVAERDRVYKKTEIQPLYAAGKISAMKDLERHFESAEKQAALNSKRDKARRIGQLVSSVEDVVVTALSTERKEMDQILAAIRLLDDGAGDGDILSRAHSTINGLKHSSKALLSLFNDLEIELNNTVVDAEIAQAESEKADAARLEELRAEKKEGEKKLVEEFTRRVHVLESDDEAIKELVERKMGKDNGSGDVEKEQRLRAALEEAKRRNGHV